MHDSPPSPFGTPRCFAAADARLAWWELGAGPTLLLVHGWPLHAATFRALAPRLAAHHRVVLVDLAGLGESSFDAFTDFRFEAHADRLAAFADAHLGPSFECIASDTGATVARLLAQRRPAVRRLGLLNTEIPGHRPPWIRSYQAIFALGLGHAALGMMAGSRRLLRSAMAFGGCFCELSHLDGEFHDLFVAPLANDGVRREGAMRYLRGVDWRTVDALAEVHRSLRCETQLIWGADDPTFPLARARAMATQFTPPAEVAVIDDAKLLVHEERPDEVARAWLRGRTVTDACNDAEVRGAAPGRR